LKVREEYRRLSRKELLDKVYELGAGYEKYSGSCSQCTVATLHNVLGFEDALVRAATSSCGGHARQSTGTCGGVVGATMVLDYYCGRPFEKMSAKEKIPANSQALGDAIGVVNLLCNRYLQEYGSILCPGIQKKMFGKSFHLGNPDEFKAFESAGGHSDPDKCLRVVGNSARWAMEILLDKGIVEI
jgi:hypothetical protein